MEPHFPGMDFDFLRYMEVRPENQRRIQSHYLPYFAQCKRVVDLACGDADFVDLLLEEGIEVVGVDSDDKAFAASAAKGRPVVQQDVFDWLAAQPDASVDGVFSAHLIEHLPYPKVVELIEQSYRILQPGGVILLVTPNARSVFSHLEMFYTHFGHITFYHPRLVNFFLDRAGFVDLHEAENPITASPLLPRLRHFVTQPAPGRIQWEDEQPGVEELFREIAQADPRLLSGSPWAAEEDAEILYQNEVPLRGRMPWHYITYWAKRLLTNLLVRPLTDSVVENVKWRVDRLQALSDERERRSREALHFLAQKLQLQQQATTRLYELLREEQAVRRSQIAHVDGVEAELHRHLREFAEDMQHLNGAFEAFNWAYKPKAEESPETDATDPEEPESEPKT